MGPGMVAERGPGGRLVQCLGSEREWSRNNARVGNTKPKVLLVNGLRLGQVYQ